MAIDTSRLKRRLPGPPPSDEGASGIEQAPPAEAHPLAGSKAPPGAVAASAARHLDGRSLRATGRTVQLNVKVTENTKEAVLRLSKAKGLLVAEVIEQAIALFDAR